MFYLVSNPGKYFLFVAPSDVHVLLNCLASGEKRYRRMTSWDYWGWFMFVEYCGNVFQWPARVCGIFPASFQRPHHATQNRLERRSLGKSNNCDTISVENFSEPSRGWKQLAADKSLWFDSRGLSQNPHTTFVSSEPKQTRIHLSLSVRAVKWCRNASALIVAVLTFFFHEKLWVLL